MSDEDSFRHGRLSPYPVRDAESLSELVREKISDDGTLHLDAIQTQLLVRYLVRVDMTMKDYAALAKRLEDLMKEIPS